MKNNLKNFLPIVLLVTLLGNYGCTTRNEKAEQSANFSINQVYEPKIDSLISLMSLDEKIAFLHGTGKFVSGGNERLGIPEFWYTDGPNGVREELERHTWRSLNLTNDSVTFFPTGTALAATWNPDLAYLFGKSIATEARARNKDMLLGPAVNIIRTPLCGRNFEYFTEDPFLNSRLTVSYVNGVQSMDVAACVKHFAANNQEYERNRVNVTMDERALREIYLPVYKAAVEEANTLGIMGAYNKFRGDYLCENAYLNNTVLKEEYGFKGIVVSDWGATHNTMKSALGGLDVEMGTREDFYDSSFMAKPLLDSVLAGKVPVEVIDDKVRRILRLYFNLKMMGEPRKTGELVTPATQEAVYTIASESIVLLKNDKQILPLQKDKLKSLAIIGVNAKQRQSAGGYTAPTKAKYEVSPYEGITKQLGADVSVSYSPGYKTELENPNGFPLNVPDAQLIAEAVEAAKNAEVALLFIGNTREVETENLDRRDIKLPFGQDELIQAVTTANPNSIVIVVAGSACDLNVAKEKSPAILYAWFNGSEAGNALADVLFGKVNPSGKLPFTLPVKLEDIGAHALKAYPGENLEVEYKEGILVGYRWFDTKEIQPLYPFGYGLSYTSFTFLSAQTDKPKYVAGETIHVKAKIKNTGTLAGKETLQCYVHANSSKVMRANKELKAFAKTEIAVNEEKEIELQLKSSDLAYYDVATGKWLLEPGDYTLMIGNSSRDIFNQVVVSIIE